MIYLNKGGITMSTLDKIQAIYEKAAKVLMIIGAVAVVALVVKDN